jgi:hypothetical protein
MIVFANTSNNKAQANATPDDPAAPDFRFRPALQTIDPELSLDVARHWLDSCQSKHEKCYRSASILPTRVLDIGTKIPVRTVKLYWSQEEEVGQYAGKLDLNWFVKATIEAQLMSRHGQHFTESDLWKH